MCSLEVSVQRVEAECCPACAAWCPTSFGWKGGELGMCGRQLARAWGDYACTSLPLRPHPPQTPSPSAHHQLLPPSLPSSPLSPLLTGSVHGPHQPADPAAHQGPQVWRRHPLWRDGARLAAGAWSRLPAARPVRAGQAGWEQESRAGRALPHCPAARCAAAARCDSRTSVFQHSLSFFPLSPLQSALLLRLPRDGGVRQLRPPHLHSQRAPGGSRCGATPGLPTARLDRGS